MRDVLGTGTVLGYCTNVHAGNTVDEAVEQLKAHAVEVKRLVSPDEPLDVGVWLPHSAVNATLWMPQSRPESFCARLAELGLRPCTVNAFPYGDFHESVVKHRVYEPTWAEGSRSAYSFEMAEALLVGLDHARYGSVSTVPLGWPKGDTGALVSESGKRLRELAEMLHMMERPPEVMGRRVTVDLEPEPGCMLDTADDVIDFFEQELPEESQRRHIGVCHDVCHAAVMFEEQVEVLKRYAEAGIRVNKVQISNAPRIALDGDRAAAFEMLRRFVEPRYLHQTMVKDDAGQWFFEDLPDAFGVLDDPREVDLSSGEWRVHFHLPLYLGVDRGAVDDAGSDPAGDSCGARVPRLQDVRGRDVRLGRAA